MLSNITGFKRALDLAEQGRLEEARTLMKSLQDEYLALFEENEALKAQLAEVADVLDMAEEVEFDGQKYWLNEQHGRKGPYCQLCYDKDGLLIRLQEHDKHWHCHNCASLFVKAHAFKAAKTKEYTASGFQTPIPLFVK